MNSEPKRPSKRVQFIPREHDQFVFIAVDERGAPFTDSTMHTTADQLAALAELDRLLTEHGVDYWLFGGWAVDFHVGQLTREHADIDMAVWLEDHTPLAALLEGAAWQHRPELGEDGYTAYERGSVRLEVAFLARDEHGEVYTPLRTGRGAWPRDSFGDAMAELYGVRARLVNRQSLIADKSVVRSGGDAAAKDRADVASLLGSDSLSSFIGIAARFGSLAITCKGCSSLIPSGSVNCPNCGASVTFPAREIIIVVLVAAAVLVGILVRHWS